ncbi:hypothetical protein SteCoe_2430 [Stentor coeruleus]|uniref:PPPDE domain-containing protein n=1 Tax=Stentor coeruleus TaxID=5963 RepID=A0A1R2CZF4_9CILI|nr:hypothetical protein SteCoe_2430 [Stentor coeruleus]
MKVYLNVYDITKYNRYIHILGLGAYHTGIEVNNTEYAYGYNFTDETGVFRTVPGIHHSLSLCERIYMGETTKTPDEIFDIISSLSEDFLGKDYHLLLKNCNHFSDTLCKILVSRSIPNRVNRVSQVAHCLSCFLPPSIWNSVLEDDRPLKAQKPKYSDFI